MTTPDRPLRLTSVALLLGLLLVARLALVLSLADVFFYGEELEKGAAAKALVDGVDWPYHQIAYHLYEGGGFVVSHLLALVFQFAGESILAHKLLALGFGVLVALAGMRLCWRHFGRTSAVCFGVLFAFGPASFQKVSLLSLGIHFEACLFLLLALDATLTLLEARREALPLAQTATLGLTLGFGFFFNYQLAVAGLWAFLWLAASRPRTFAPRSLAVGLGGLLLGLLPLLLMASRVGARVFDIHGTPLATVQGNFGTFAEFVRSLYVGRAPLELCAALLYPASLLGALWMLRGGGRGDTDPVRRNALRLATFLGLWGAVYLTSGFVVGRVSHPFQLLRFAPLWIVASVLVCAGLARALGSAKRSVATTGRAAALALVALGIASTWSAAVEGSPATWRANLRQLHATKGYDYAGYFAKVFQRLADPDQCEKALTGFDEPQRALLVADYAQALGEHARESPAQMLTQLARSLTRARRPTSEGEGSAVLELADGVRGLGAYASRLAGRDIEAALGLASGIPEELQPAWGEAVGRFGNAYAEFPGRIEAQLANLGPGPRREDFLRGTGYRIWRRFVLGPFGTVRFQLKPAAVERWIESLPAEERAFLREGFERGSELHRLPGR